MYWLLEYGATRVARMHRFIRQTNPWMLIALLAVAGWTLDTLLVSLEVQQMPGAGIMTHLTHLWGGPPLLLAGLWLARRGLARWGPRKSPPTVEHLTAELPPLVQGLARQMVASPAQATLLAQFWAYPATARLPDDLARQLGHPLPEVEAALAGLVAAGLLEPIGAGDLLFYRLTRNPVCLQCLAELVAWQETWLEHSRSLATSVGRPVQDHPVLRTDR